MYFGGFKGCFFNSTPEKFNSESGSFLIKKIFELDEQEYS